jgi:hypothetical protein
LQKLTQNIQNKNYILKLQNYKYLLNIKVKNSKSYIQLTRSKQIGTLITDTFQTLTGGILYYDHRNLFECNQINRSIFYPNRINSSNKYKSIVSHRTIIWMGEEIHKVNCEPNILLVEHSDFISEGFEIIPGLFSKTSGIVIIRQKKQPCSNNLH